MPFSNTALGPNQFDLTPILGSVDQKMNYNTTVCQIDSSQATALLAGQAVKIVDSVDGVPKVVACAAASDNTFGFINYNFKNASFKAGDAVEVSQAGNVITLVSFAAIARGAQVQLDVTQVGGVKTITAASGADLVGFAMDKATAAGQLIRVKLSNPSFAKA